MREISFDVEKGEAFGVIGRNGSGKSTLLKIISGILKPTSGQLFVDGRVSALIELGAGFHPEISGRENVYINGIMLGLTRREIGAVGERVAKHSQPSEGSVFDDGFGERDHLKVYLIRARVELKIWKLIRGQGLSSSGQSNN